MNARPKPDKQPSASDLPKTSRPAKRRRAKPKKNETSGRRTAQSTPEPATAPQPPKRNARRKSPSKLPAKGARGDSRKKVVLLSGGNPQIAKADGDTPVQAYLDAIPDWKQAVARRLDSLVVRLVPDVRKAVKWNSPFYGVEGQGWFMSFHVFKRYVKVTFFQGTSLQPPPAGGTSPDARWIDVHEDDFDEARLSNWIRQAAAIPGWLA